MSIIATIISTFIGITAAVIIATNRFPLKSLLVGMINTGMAFPPVFVGLVVTIFLWRNGPLGNLGILYSPTAIILAQVIIATPMITGIGIAAIQSLHSKLQLQILGLGASKIQMSILLIREAKLPILSAIMAGFGAVISEVGAAIMVGGNIKGYTRVLTTATVLETSKGNFDTALALGFILLFITFLINLFLTYLQQKGRTKVE